MAEGDAPIALGPFEVVTKLEAASRQLAMTIELCLLERDAVSTRTLAAAAHEILRTLLRRIPGHHGSALFDNPLADAEMRERFNYRVMRSLIARPTTRREQRSRITAR